MSSRKNCRIRTTTRQRARFNAVVQYFAERGYFVVPVARWYQRHYLDVLVIPKEAHGGMILILPGRHDTVELRPYLSRNISSDLIQELRKKRKNLPGIRWRRQLPLKRNKDWRQYVSPYHTRELSHLV